MEHLLFDGGSAPIVFSYAGGESWDGGDFQTYPERKGWDVSIWDWSEGDADVDTHDLPLDALAAFLQSWLFFGLLETVLGVKVDSSDFLREVNDNGISRRVITTSKLAIYLENLLSDYARLSDQQKLQREDTVWDALSEAMIVTFRLNTRLNLKSREQSSSMLIETLLCQTLLHLAVARFIEKLIPTVDWNLRGPQFLHLLENRMTDADWCPFDVQFLTMNLNPDIVAFIFSLGSKTASKDHRLCHNRYTDSRDHCIAESAGRSSLPKHTQSECVCPLLGPDMDLVERAIRNGNVPVVALVLPQNDSDDIVFRLGEEELPNEGPCMGRYFALSHVWKEGLGNPNANLLPSCQIKRMAGLMNNVKGTEEGMEIQMEDPEYPACRMTVPFWMDTFCIPVSPQSQDLRNASIARMRKIYASARGVIALDPDLQSIPSNASPAVLMGLLLSCSWRSRLWTYQEGNLAWSLLIPTQTNTFQVDKAIEQYPEVEPEREDPTDGTANGLIQTAMTRSMADACRTIVRSSVPPQISRDPERELRTMLRAMAHRNTSRQGDEAICISTYMDVDPTPLLAERPENRLSKLLHILPALSKAILFAQGPRLQQPGLRWAPQTFLNPHGYKEDIQFETHYKPDGPGTDIRGLPPPYLCPKGRGLVAFFSGIKMESQFSNPLAEHFTVRVSAEKSFVVDLDDTSDCSFTRSQVCADASIEFAILFANERKIRSTANAMLVEWLGAAEDGVLRCKRQHEVSIQDVDECILEGTRLEKLREASYQGRLIPMCRWVVD